MGKILLPCQVRGRVNHVCMYCLAEPARLYDHLAEHHPEKDLVKKLKALKIGVTTDMEVKSAYQKLQDKIRKTGNNMYNVKILENPTEGNFYIGTQSF